MADEVTRRTTPLWMWLVFDAWLVCLGFVLGWWLA